MQTALLDAWKAVHGGSPADISALVDESMADAAIARMMVYRRRAVIPRVIEEFLERVGGVFAPKLPESAPQAALDFLSEIAAAKAASRLAEGACGEAPPLLFERAMLADMEGRRSDALADLRRLLDAYPGFVTAAFATARLVLADNDPIAAIESLACVESELIQTREGSALLADALHAVGFHEAASHYDLIALTNVGSLDSRGNDCAPVDVVGGVVSHSRMLPAFFVATLPDGRMLYNDRGVYYVTRSAISHLLSAMFKSIGLRARTERTLGRILPRLAALGLLEIPERNRDSDLVRARLRSGIASIFGLSTAAFDLNVDRLHVAKSTEAKVGFGLAPIQQQSIAQMSRYSALPPQAEELLHRLLILAGISLKSSAPISSARFSES